MYQTGDLAMMREDGAFIFLGRNDQQIKLHGYRIEPGEVELALRELPNVAEALVVARRLSGTSQRLIAYVAGRPGMPSLDKQHLQKALAAKLPNYMIPQIMTLSALPRLVSGKIDRNALPDPAEIDDETEISLPQSKEEAVLAAIWCEVFDCTSLPATKDFFELGGTSIMGMRLVARIRAELGAKIELHDLFRSPTIRSLALVAAQSREREMLMATPIPRRERQPRLYAGSQENV